MTRALSDYDVLPSNDDMHDELRWVTDEDPYERLIHDRTGTQVDIRKGDDGTYSVQIGMGMHDDTVVVQPNDPTELVSGVSCALTMDEDSVETCRALATAWMIGWMHRTHHADDILDLED